MGAQYITSAPKSAQSSIKPPVEKRTRNDISQPSELASCGGAAEGDGFSRAAADAAQEVSWSGKCRSWLGSLKENVSAAHAEKLPPTFKEEKRTQEDVTRVKTGRPVQHRIC